MILPADEQLVDELISRHRHTYVSHKRDASTWYWVRLLLGEVWELLLALVGRHEHSPQIELMQIAGICANWIAKDWDEETSFVELLDYHGGPDE